MFVEGDLVDAVVPFMGESITDGTLAKFLKSMFCSIHFPVQVCTLCHPPLQLFDCVCFWFSKTDPGDTVEVDEPIAQIETDKVLCTLPPFPHASLPYFPFYQ